jgi:hypothetical protein
LVESEEEWNCKIEMQSNSMIGFTTILHEGKYALAFTENKIRVRLNSRSCFFIPQHKCQYNEILHPIGIMKFPTFEKTAKFDGLLTSFQRFYGKTNKSLWTFSFIY